MGGTGVGLEPGGGSRGASAGGLGTRAILNPSLIHLAGCAISSHCLLRNQHRALGSAEAASLPQFEPLATAAISSHIFVTFNIAPSRH
jgi:hypothetical protein